MLLLNISNKKNLKVYISRKNYPSEINDEYPWTSSLPTIWIHYDSEKLRKLTTWTSNNGVNFVGITSDDEEYEPPNKIDF